MATILYSLCAQPVLSSRAKTTPTANYRKTSRRVASMAWWHCRWPLEFPSKCRPSILARWLGKAVLVGMLLLLSATAASAALSKIDCETVRALTAGYTRAELIKLATPEQRSTYRHCFFKRKAKKR